MGLTAILDLFRLTINKFKQSGNVRWETVNKWIMPRVLSGQLCFEYGFGLGLSELVELCL